MAVYAGKESDSLALSGDSSSNSYYNSTNLKAASIACYVIAGLAVLVVLFYISTISLCIAVIKSAALFVA